MDNKPRLKEKYEKEVKASLQKEFNIKNVMSIPSITNIVINSGLGDGKSDSALIDQMVEDIAMIAGQRPVITTSKKAISNFKIRIGDQVGVKVTLRRDMMWEFLDRLISIALPRIKDFRGVSYTAFDNQGNYSLGIKEHTVFPEVDSTKSPRIRGLQITIGTSTDDKEQALALLTKLGMPFKKSK